MIPFVKIVVNIIRNEIVGGGQGMSIGAARIRAISISKIMNKIISRKNRRTTCILCRLSLSILSAFGAIHS